MTKHTKTYKISLLTVSVAGLLALSSCQGTGSGTTAADFEAAKQTRIDSALERAAGKAAQSGKTKESLALLEKVYKRNSDDPNAAIRYAKALRNTGYLNRAAMVISPFARDIDSPHATAKTEFAAIQAAMGNYSTSEEYARQSLTLQPENNAIAHHVLGIALDAQGAHKEAEQEFRTALENWEGDPSMVMNNLGLNLAAQGKLAEAIETLKQAKEISPMRMEIERNLRIVTALQGDKHIEEYKSVPKPQRRPD